MILSGKKLIAPAEEGIHSVEIGNAMLLSSLSDETVEVPVDGAVFEAKLKELIESSKFEKKTVAQSGPAYLSGSF